MKNQYFLPSLILATALIITGYFIGNTYLKGREFDRFVSVKGLSEREVPADLAVWPINIMLTGNDLSDLQMKIEAQNQEVYKFFSAQGFEPDEITRGTVNISDARANIYNSNAQYSAFRYLAK